MSESLIKQYYEGLEKGELRAQACGDCGKVTFPPTAACEHCGSAKLSVKKLSGKGKLLFASHGIAPPPNPRFAPYAPYVYGQVALQEGVVVQAVIRNLKADPVELKEVYERGPVEVEVDVLKTADLPVLAFRVV